VTWVELIEPKLSDAGMIVADYPCAACGYNLRGLAAAATCPECGQSVAATVVARRRRVENLWHFENFSLGSRIGYALLGIVLPLVCFALSTMQSLIGPDWQSDELSDQVGLLYGGEPLVVFYPLLLGALVALAVVLVRPLAARQSLVLRLGVYSGVALALQYFMILCLSSSVTMLLVGPVLWCGAAGLFIGVTHTYRYYTNRWRLRSPECYKQSRNALLGILGVFFLLVMGLPALGGEPGMVFLPALVALVFAPALTLLVYVLVTIRIVKTGVERRDGDRILLPLLLIGWVPAWLGAWALAIRQAIAIYQTLPITPPDCYIATAAARGHRRLVGGEIVRFADGSAARINRQLRICKCAELALRAGFPRGHRICRALYDTLGSPLAARIRHPLLADAAFLLAWPPTLLAWLVLRMVVGDVEGLIGKVYPNRA